MLDQRSETKKQNLNQNSKPELKVRAFYLSINIIRFLEVLPNKQSVRIISAQLIRSVTSVGTNIVEVKSSSSKKEFLNYFQVVLKSSNEAKYWLAMLRELFPKEKDQLDIFLQELEELSKIIGTSILTMKGKTKL